MCNKSIFLLFFKSFSPSFNTKQHIHKSTEMDIHNYLIKFNNFINVNLRSETLYLTTYRVVREPLEK